MEKSILIDSFLLLILRKNEYFGYFRSRPIKVFKKNVNSESKDEVALCTRYFYKIYINAIILAIRIMKNFYSSSYVTLMIRMIFDASLRKHESAHPSSSVILFSPVSARYRK